jgi:purine nucleosidase
LAQDFPKLSETFRLKQLEPPTGTIRMVLDTDTYNEVDDQFALAYTVLSKDKIKLEAVYAAPCKAVPRTPYMWYRSDVLQILHLLS